MDEIDGGIRLQQIAPGALAGMRLARYQQHPQAVAHALGRDDGAVVLKGDLALELGNRQLDQILAAMADLDARLGQLAGITDIVPEALPSMEIANSTGP